MTVDTSEYPNPNKKPVYLWLTFAWKQKHYILVQGIKDTA